MYRLKRVCRFVAILSLPALTALQATASGSFGPELHVITGIAFKKICDSRIPGFEEMTRHDYEKWLAGRKVDIDKTKDKFGEKHFEASIESMVDGVRSFPAQELEPECSQAAQQYKDCSLRLARGRSCTN